MHFLLLATLVYSIVCGCPPGYMDLEGAKKCVKYVPTAASFNDALDDCRREGGDLVSVPNAFFNSALFELRGSGDMILLGLVLHTKSNWAWTDSATIHYTNWALHQPSPGNECVALNGNDATWYSVSCQQDMPYFCEHAETSGCPSNWKEYNGNCYDFRSSSEQALTWHEAEEDCVKDGAHLASIHSQEENDVVASLNTLQVRFLGQYQLLLHTVDWTSLPKTDWSDGSPVEYTHDDVSCPFKGHGIYLGGNCPKGQGNWEMVPSTTILKAHFCKAPMHVACWGRYDGWVSYNGSCYTIRETEGLTFEQAEQDCVQSQSHLASIHDGYDNIIVGGYQDLDPGYAHFCKFAWIGLQCTAGGYRWTDDTYVSYMANPDQLQNCYPTDGARFTMYAGSACDNDRTWAETNATQTSTGHVCKKPLSF